MSRFALRTTLLAAALLLISAASAVAQTEEPSNCGSYEGIVCNGWFSDNAGVAEDDAAIEAAIGALVERYGNQIAFVTVSVSPYGSPLEFAP